MLTRTREKVAGSASSQMLEVIVALLGDVSMHRIRMEHVRADGVSLGSPRSSRVSLPFSFTVFPTRSFGRAGPKLIESSRNGF